MNSHIVYFQKISQILFCVFLLVGAVVFCVPKTYASDINLEDGLVGYWNFDEDDESPIASDRSGNGNDGALMGGPTREEGKIGKAMRFDGADDYVDVKTNPVSSGAYSVSLWANSATNANFTNTKNLISRNRKYQIGMISSSGKLYSYAAVTGGDPPIVSSSVTMTPGTWHNIVLVVGASSIQIFFDGISVGSSSQSSIEAGTGDLIIGGLDNSNNSVVDPTYFFNGSIDEVRVYNRALSEEEIEALQDSYSDPSTLTITVPSESTTTLRNFIPIEFTVKTPIFPKRTPDGLSSNKMRVELDNRFPITIRHDRDEEDEDEGITYSIWKGVYNKPKGLSNIPFYITGTLEMANCDKDTGEKIPFNIQQETRGTYTIQKTLQDDEIVTQTDFISLETPTPLPVECPSFLQKPISFLGCFFFGSSSEEPSLTETETTTVYASIDEDDETMNEARARKLCKKPVEDMIENNWIRNGLVGYWNFDEDDDSSIAFDRSGNGNDGVLVGGPTREEGKIGKAMSFDGVNDYVDVPDINFVTEFTYATWFYTTRNSQPGSWQAGIIFGDADGFGGGGKKIGLAAGSIVVSLLNPSNHDRVVAPPANSWHFIAVTRSISNKVYLYVDNGNSDLQIFPVDKQVFDKIGCNGGDLSQKFFGKLDEVRIYNRALSAEEVARLYMWGR